MIRSLLVPATGTETDLTALTTAAKIARAFSAHIEVLHVRLDAIDVAVQTASGQGGPLVEHLIQQLEQDAHERESRARLTFEDFCTRENVPVLDGSGSEPAVGPSAQWHVETGDEADTIAAHGMFVDLLIVARSAGQHFTTRLILESALLNTGRPLLIPSAGGTPSDFRGDTGGDRVEADTTGSPRRRSGDAPPGARQRRRRNDGRGGRLILGGWMGSFETSPGTVYASARSALLRGGEMLRPSCPMPPRKKPAFCHGRLWA